MADSTRTRSATVWIVVTMLVAAYAIWVTIQTDRLREQAATAQAREQGLTRQIQELAMAIPTRAGTRAPDALVAELLRRPDLIPLEPVLGGTFYFLEDTVVELSERYVYATVEDGHVRGHVLLDRGGDAGLEVIHAYLE